VLDRADTLVLAARLLRTRPAVAAAAAAQWRHVVCCGMQDATPAMLQLLEALSAAAAAAGDDGGAGEGARAEEGDQEEGARSLVLFSDPSRAVDRHAALGCVGREDGATLEWDWLGTAFRAAFHGAQLEEWEEPAAAPDSRGSGAASFRRYASAWAEASAVAAAAEDAVSRGASVAVVGARSADARLAATALQQRGVALCVASSGVLRPPLWTEPTAALAVAFLGAMGCPDEPWHLYDLLVAPPTNLLCGNVFAMPAPAVARLVARQRKFRSAARAARAGRLWAAWWAAWRSRAWRRRRASGRSSARSTSPSNLTLASVFFG